MAAMDTTEDGSLAELRKRSASIDSYVDMIPFRFYLGGDAATQPQKRDRRGRHVLDLAWVKTTSQMVAEAATAGEAGEASAASASRQKKGKKRKSGAEDRGGGSTNGRPAPKSRAELVGRLNSRIAELKEERRRRQSAADKAKAAAKKEAAGTSPNGDPAKAPRLATPRASSVKDEAEPGRLVFDPKASQVPFETGVNRRGAKAARLRQSMREVEKDNKLLEKADHEGRRDDARREIAMRKALQRARGEKVVDDVSYLKKGQKNIELGKKRTKEQWKERVAQMEGAAMDKQQKRKENLAKKRSKKARERDGFEGKDSGYLNKDKDD